MGAPERMHRAYVEAALFSSTDDEGEPLDKKYSASDFSDAARTRMRHDVDSFYRQCAYSIGSNYERAGHDFWLTRNHHGAGFWDGDWPEPDASLLTNSAHAFGEQDIYVGDDGELHVTGEHEFLAAVFPPVFPRITDDPDTDLAAKVALGALAVGAIGFGWYVMFSNKIA